ncbi:MAG: response regulator transcription factor [Kaiparowitsia implicata GSE-PSE-MK54-09C]|jgi:DNA-binding CsgD family transcriptional regulator|nr:response regulator transcription factor [Kaiparowitsia implicata GSE-PSE-MK54-09C]
MAIEETQHASTLSERELQIVELVASGLTNQEIAEQLDISKRTVDNHISNILSKTETGNRVALVRWALQWGKVCIDEVNCCTLPVAGGDGAPSGAQMKPSNAGYAEAATIDGEAIAP